MNCDYLEDVEKEQTHNDVGEEEDGDKEILGRTLPLVGSLQVRSPA